jgi:protein required for attachment to host cells
MFVVADQNQAQLYRVEGTRLDPTLAQVEQLEHEREDITSTGSHRSLSFVDHDAHDDETRRRFVRRLVDRLRRGKQTGEFQRLYIAAPAGFVGRIRSLYGSNLASSVEREIIGDYTQQSRRKLEQRVRGWIS